MDKSRTSHSTAVAEHYDARASRYDESEMHRELARAVVDFARLESVHRVLDVATGTGLVLRALAAKNSAVSLTGVDISLGMLVVAREHLPGADLRQTDATALDLSSFDLVTCVTALHLFPRPSETLAAWSRVLRPSGRIITATFAPRDREQPAEKHGVPRRFEVNHGPVATPEGLGAVAAEAGLDLIRHERWSHDNDALLLAELAPTRR